VLVVVLVLDLCVAGLTKRANRGICPGNVGSAHYPRHVPRLGRSLALPAQERAPNRNQKQENASYFDRVRSM
jgi:hypothetical protein